MSRCLLEDEAEQDKHYESIGGKDSPGDAPSAYLLHQVQPIGIDELVYYCLGRECAYGGAYAVGHHEEETLGTAAHTGIGLLVYIEGAGYVEEVESHAIYQHGEDEEPYTAAGIAYGEEAEAERPCHHGYLHHPLDAEAFQEEGYKEYAERFAHL